MAFSLIIGVYGLTWIVLAWAGAAVKKIAEFNERLKFEAVGTPVEMKQGMKADIAALSRELAVAMADRLKADRE